jgi:eukaryotic-like serine/threonine-protein kinase
MMPTMPSTSRICADCGAVLPSDAPGTFCPRCLVRLAQRGREVSSSSASAGPEGDEALAGEDLCPSSFRGATGSGAQPTGPEPQQALHSFGDYELFEEIARGGMGIVYRARQISLDRLVAIKVLIFGPLGNPEFIKRFRLEASTAGALQHPNIVAIHEVGIHEGHHYLVMDYVDGPNFAKFVANQPLSARRAAAYLKSIAEAVDYAHRNGILHRDLKPSNILLDSNDQPRVTDFGLAKRLEGDVDLTITGQVLGSPNYMSPEQAAANRGNLNRATDVYSLGAILYHLLTARPLFQAETLSTTLLLVQTTEPVSPRVLNASVPRDLETICLKCLEKERVKRYGTAQELADDLARFLRDEPILARPVTHVERAWRWCRRKPALATLGALVLVLLLLVLVVVGAPIAIFRIDRARADANSALVEAERSRVEANSARVEVERSLYSSDMRLASEELRDGAIGQVQELLKPHEPRNGAEDLRRFEWRYLRNAADQSGLVTHPLQGLRATPIASKHRIVSTGTTLYNLQGETGQILAWDMRTWAPLPLKLPSQRASERWWWYPAEQAALAINEKDRTISVYRLPGFEEASVISVPGSASQAALSQYGSQNSGGGISGWRCPSHPGLGPGCKFTTLGLW